VVGDDLILDLECGSSANCNGTFVSSVGDKEKVDRDICKPNFPSVEFWHKFLSKNLTYPLAARNAGAQGEVWVGVKIGSSGEIMESAIMNPTQSHTALITEVERILDRYDGGFVAARDLEGECITAWMYFPIRFSLN
jgi:hypothetical protein